MRRDDDDDDDVRGHPEVVRARARADANGPVNYLLMDRNVVEYVHGVIRGTGFCSLMVLIIVQYGTPVETHAHARDRRDRARVTRRATRATSARAVARGETHRYVMDDA